jgi:hypothetical protein
MRELQRAQLFQSCIQFSDEPNIYDVDGIAFVEPPLRS